MGGAPHPTAIVEMATDIVAFVVLTAEPGTNGKPPRAKIRIVDVLRGELQQGEREASFPPPADEAWYAIRSGRDGALDEYNARPRHGPAIFSKLIAVVHPQSDGSVMVEPRVLWPDNDGRRACIVWGASAAVTIIATPADDPSAFEQLDTDARRYCGGGWNRFPVRSGRRLDTFFGFATHTDLGMFACEQEVDQGDPLWTCLIDRHTVVSDLPVLERLVETEADKTARALWEHGGATGDLARIGEALRTGTWPTRADPAEEAAAFAHHLLKFGRDAKEMRMGVCWEYRGTLRAQVSPPPTERMRELEQLYAQIWRARMFAGHVDMWEHGGSSSATDDERATMYAELAGATRKGETARAELAVLVGRLRAEAPHEVDAWAFAHYAYVSMLLHDHAEQGHSDSSAAAAALRERNDWVEVRTGKRAFVDENMYAPIHQARYRAHFGIDPHTLEPVDD